jgi:hypothetical protein
MDNLLQLEPELLARLKEQLADVRPAVHLLSAADLAGVEEEKQLSPAVHLVYQRYRVAESRSDGRAARITQTWLPVVAVRNASTTKTGTAGRIQAGALAARVMRALVGWQPPSATKPLQLVAAPPAGFSKTFQYLPLAVEAEIVFKTNP